MVQAVPGPLFTFAAYLGAVMGPTPNGIAGAAIALVAIFLPGLLLVYGMLPFWDELRSRQAVQAAMRGANAAVVGILGLALYNPIWTSSVRTPRDFALAVGGFLLLTVWKAPPWVVVILLAAAGTLLARRVILDRGMTRRISSAAVGVNRQGSAAYWMRRAGLILRLRGLRGISPLLIRLRCPRSSAPSGGLGLR